MTDAWRVCVGLVVSGTLLLSSSGLAAEARTYATDSGAPLVAPAACDGTVATSDDGCWDAIQEARDACSDEDSDEDSGSCWSRILSAIWECRVWICGAGCVASHWGEWPEMLECIMQCIETLD